MSKGRSQEQEVERKIAEYHERGVCDSHGATIPKEYRSANVDSRHRGDFRKYQEGYERIYGN